MLTIQTIQNIRALLTSQQCTFTGNQFPLLASILSELHQEELAQCQKSQEQDTVLTNSADTTPEPIVASSKSRAKPLKESAPKA